MSIIASQCIDAPIQHSHAHVAAAAVHGRYLLPGVQDGVKSADTVEMLHPVKAANTVDVAFEEGGAMIGTRALSSNCHVGPSVSSDIIRFNAVGWITTTPAANGQKYGGRQSRVGDGVRNVARRCPVCGESTNDPRGGIDNGRAPFAFPYKCIRHHGGHDVVHVHQG